MEKKKRKVRKIITVIIIVGILAGAVALTAALTKKTKDKDGFLEISPGFSVGSLDENGEFVSSKESLVMKNAVAADKIKVLLEFDSELSYQLYFYDEYDNFISAGVALRKGCEAELPEGATHFRVLVTPIWATDAEDTEINFFEKFGIADKITVKVYEEVEEPAEDSEATTENETT